MINLLTEELPCSISVCGKNYPINTDFRVWIRVEEILSSDISAADKILRCFSLIFASKDIPSSVDETLSSILYFLSPFYNTLGGKKTAKCNEPLFDFAFDSGLIYAAFLSQYNIDLTSDHLHWWRFLSLFCSLSPCKFTEVVRIRGTSLCDIGDKAQKSYIRKMKKIYRIPASSGSVSSEIDKLF